MYSGEKEEEEENENEVAFAHVYERASDPLAWAICTFDSNEYHESKGSLLLDVLSFKQVCKAWHSAVKRVPVSHLVAETKRELKVKGDRLQNVFAYFDQFFSMCKPAVPFGHKGPHPAAAKEMRETCEWVNGRLREMRSHLRDLQRLRKTLTM